MRRIDHSRLIIWGSRQTAMPQQLLPGMFLHFRYKSKSDPRPLVLFLYHDKQKNVYHGINLNYLTEGDIKRLFKYLVRELRVEQETTEMRYSQGGQTIDVRGLEKPFSRIYIKQYGQDNVEDIYGDIIKPQLVDRGPRYDVYRTYSLDKITDPKICQFNLKSLGIKHTSLYDTATGDFDPDEEYIERKIAEARRLSDIDDPEVLD